MAKYRYVKEDFWSDPEMLDMTPEDKFFYIYLLTNPHTSQCGIYKISIKYMIVETGYNNETIRSLIRRFEEKDKIVYDGETKEMCIKNWPKYNYTQSNTVGTRILSELKNVTNKKLIKCLNFNGLTVDYLEKIYTLSIGYRQKKEKEKEKEKGKKKEITVKIEIPENLNFKTFHNAWEEFQLHRIQMKSKMSDLAKSKLLKKLSRYDVNVAIGMLGQSVENGWKGVFDLQRNRSGKETPESLYEEFV